MLIASESQKNPLTAPTFCLQVRFSFLRLAEPPASMVTIQGGEGDTNTSTDTFSQCFKSFFIFFCKPFTLKAFFPSGFIHFLCFCPSTPFLHCSVCFNSPLQSSKHVSTLLIVSPLSSGLAGERRQPVGGGLGLPESMAAPQSRRWPRQRLICCCARVASTKGQTGHPGWCGWQQTHPQSLQRFTATWFLGILWRRNIF